MNTNKSLGLFGTFCIGAGSMISSGLFVLPAIAFSATGPSVILSYALASLFIVPALFSKAELASAMPKAGGSYFFIERSLGTLPGLLTGLANWFSLALKSAFALLGIGAIAKLAFPDLSLLQVKIVAISFCALLTIINLTGIGSVGRAQNVLVGIVVAILCVYVFMGVGKVDVLKFKNFLPNGGEALLATAGLVVVSFGGLKKIAMVAEEIDNPGRNIPLGMFLAFSTVSVLYVVVVLVTVGLVDAKDMAESLTPISLGAGAVMGRAGSVMLAIAAVLAFLTTANSGIAGAARSPFAMSRDELLPKFMQKSTKKTDTPYVAIIFTSGFMAFVIAFLSIKNLVKTASTMMLVVFVLVNAAVVVMREGKVQSYRPVFRSPLYPWIQGAAIILYCILIYEMGLLPLITTGVFGLIGLGWYAIYCKARARKQTALIHLVERVTSQALADDSLESELRKIVHERDEIVEDRFDRLVKLAEVIDIQGPISSQEMLAEAAKRLAPRFEASESDLHNLFLQREHESSTEVGEGIAIPHVIIDGEHLFDIILVRCKDGISFSTSATPVHTAFVLVGSRDERNYHLRALMAIAQIVQEPGFKERWLESTSPEQMKNTMLLSKRKRAKETD
ncbi:MAG: amino acid permease [Candidatus Coatesbacteria bacterium]|nr:amino acid permease [Candidatus Coatesbacteria bacterium]